MSSAPRNNHRNRGQRDFFPASSRRNPLKPRAAAPLFDEVRACYLVVTLVRASFPAKLCVSLENPDERELAEQDPHRYLALRPPILCE